MTQSRKQKPTIAELLKLVDRLSAEEREQLMNELNAEDFRRNIQRGIDAAERGELKSADEVIDRLRKKAQSK